ncbi:hypothetical protein MKW94_021870, partial [Papaver nudicaule]|nr:hypothetical protein [Papaver nudicaule]
MEMQQQGGGRRRRSMEDQLCGLWTNEKHVNFLNWMEDSFVRTMLDHRENNKNNNKNNRRNSGSNNGTRRTHQLLPLDRFLPDSSESTRDVRRHHYKITAATAHKFSVVDADPDTATSAREDEEMTCLSLRPYDSSASASASSSSNDQ